MAINCNTEVKIDVEQRRRVATWLQKHWLVLLVALKRLEPEEALNRFKKIVKSRIYFRIGDGAWKQLKRAA